MTALYLYILVSCLIGFLFVVNYKEAETGSLSIEERVIMFLWLSALWPLYVVRLFKKKPF